MKYIAAVGLLGASCAVWSAVPLSGTGTLGILLLVVASACVLAGVLRLVRKDAVQGDPFVFPGLLVNLAGWASATLMAVEWETIAAAAVVVLETLHKSRPWHTGVLGVAVVCYLLAVHQAESAVPSGVFRGQARVLGSSLALLVVVTGVAMIPSARTGPISGWLEVMAALAAMTAGGLALPL
jgi:hypothetical protein